MQYHPAPSQEQAWNEAPTALVIRELLLLEAARLGVEAPDATEAGEEALIEALLAREVAAPEPDEAACRRYGSENPSKFRAPDVYEAAHILFAAPPDDEAAQALAMRAATETLAELKASPKRFAALARERSACPSGASGGLLGQQSRGDLVPEFETFVLALEEGQICPVPVTTRYGCHVLCLDRIARGAVLPFDTVAPHIARYLAARAWRHAVSRYLSTLVTPARIEGLTIEPNGTGDR